MILTLVILALAATAHAGDLFAKPGRLIPVGHGSKLSLYCTGQGRPTVVFESGFGGGTAETWSRLQPALAKHTRTCSYDRAGYGFSTLGRNLPRDLNHAVADLATLLRRSGEPGPYILVGHSNGGILIGAYANLHPASVAALVFLDAAVTLPEDAALPQDDGPLAPGLQAHLDKIRGKLAAADRRHRDQWRAYLFEAENNYSGASSRQARALLPHRWTHLPVRVFTANVSTLGDPAVATASRRRGEERQQSLCTFAKDCEFTLVPTANHLVHNDALDQVVASIVRLKH